jgi:hypothetical protein
MEGTSSLASDDIDTVRTRASASRAALAINRFSAADTSRGAAQMIAKPSDIFAPFPPIAQASQAIAQASQAGETAIFTWETSKTIRRDMADDSRSLP